MPLHFNNYDRTELVYDAHKKHLEPKGERVISSLLTLSLYGNYYFYNAIPYVGMYFGATVFTSLFFGMSVLNMSMARLATLTEMVLLPSKDKVRMTLYGGNTLESDIKDLVVIKSTKMRITMMCKQNNKPLRVVLETHATPEYFN
jgi:hypothetical protein